MINFSEIFSQNSSTSTNTQFCHVEKCVNKFTKQKEAKCRLYFIFVFMYRFLKVAFIAFTFIFLVSILDSCRSKGPYNPYLKMKTKPNKMQMDADKKVIKKGNRAYKRQLGNNRYHLFGRRKPPGG